MLTPEQFATLETGDAIETAPLFPALSDEPMVLLAGPRLGQSEMDFTATWKGINLGQWTAKCEFGSVTWLTW